LGIPGVTLSKIAGTSVFAAIQTQLQLWLQIMVGLASVAAALLTSLQNLPSYSERVEKHRLAGAKYGAPGREPKQLRAPDKAPSNEAIMDVRKRLDDLVLDARIILWRSICVPSKGISAPVRNNGRRAFKAARMDVDH